MPFASPDTHTAAQNLVSFYVDECLERGRPEMVPMKAQVAQRAKLMLNDGVSVEKVQRAIIAFIQRRGRTPLQLPEIYAELEREGGTPFERPSVRRLANAWIKENGWPTGAKFVHGTHSGSYVYDPLGTEKLPIGYADWPHPRPTFDDIAQALASQ